MKTPPGHRITTQYWNYNRQLLHLSSMKLEEVMEVQYFKAGLNYAAAAAGAKQQQSEENLQSRMKEVFIDQAQKAELIRLLTAQPGAERILRTGTPVPVPPVCCTED